MPMTDTTDSAATTLAIAGEFNIFNAASLKTQLLEVIHQAPTLDIEIDLYDVTEIDTAGLQLMIMAKREAAKLGKSVRFSNHSGPVLELIELCDLTGFFGDPVLIRSTL